MANESQATQSRNVFKKIGQYLKEVRLEIKKISWPTHKQTFKSTLLVLFVVALLGVALYGFDTLLLWVSKLINGLI